jgi:hypothetical protein
MVAQACHPSYRGGVYRRGQWSGWPSQKEKILKITKAKRAGSEGDSSRGRVPA